jgi:hypothetical protein
MTIWKIDPDEMTLVRDLDDGRQEVIPIPNNGDMRFMKVMDVRDYTALIVDYKEACR